MNSTGTQEKPRLFSPARLVFFVSFLLLVPWAGNRDFYSRGEPREALVVQNIVETGNWILPHGYGGVVPSKPPLLHWVAALFSMAAGEVNEFTVRLPSALACVFFLMHFFFFLKKRVGEEKAAASALFLLCAGEWFRHAISVRVDLMLSAFTCSAMLLLFEWAERECRGYPWAGMFLLVAATLTKGPVGALLPLAVLGTYLLIRKKSFPSAAGHCLSVFLPVIFLSSIWYVLAWRAQPEAFAGKVYYENVQRLLGTQEDEPHRRSAAALVLTLIPGLAPWSILLIPSGIARAIRWRRPGPADLKTWWNGLASFHRFFLLMLVFFAGFYSLPSGKRSVYLLPVYPVLCTWICLFAVDAAGRARRLVIPAVRLLAGVVIVVYGLAALVLVSRPDIESLLPGGQKAAVISIYLDALQGACLRWSAWQWILVLLPLPAWLALVFPVGGRYALQYPLRAVLGPVCLLLLAGNAVIFTPFAQAVSPRQFAEELNRLVPREAALYSWGSEAYGLSFYMRHPISRYEESRPREGYVVLYRRDLAGLEKEVAPGVVAEFLAESGHGIVRPREKLVLVRLRPALESGP